MRTCRGKRRAKNGAADPAAALRPSEHPAAPAPSRYFTDYRLRHCIGRQVERKNLKRAAVPRTFPRAVAPDGTRALPNRRR